MHMNVKGERNFYLCIIFEYLSTQGTVKTEKEKAESAHNLVMGFYRLHVISHIANQAVDLVHRNSPSWALHSQVRGCSGLCVKEMK